MLSGTVVLMAFNFSLGLHNDFIAESYYELEPQQQAKEELKPPKASDNLNNTKATTNRAFNEANRNKQFAQAYKTIAPPKDYEPLTRDAADNSGIIENYKSKYKNTRQTQLDNTKTSSFDKVNEVLEKQKNANANAKSSVSFSLINRTAVYIPIPVYLCEFGGKIVVNITVNSQGDVIDAYTNTSSTSKNACLIEHALEYAKKSVFSVDASKPSQIGTITFHFIGK